MAAQTLPGEIVVFDLVEEHLAAVEKLAEQPEKVAEAPEELKISAPAESESAGKAAEAPAESAPQI